ncbi:hypothetical protein [Polaribacter uvawellassae]|uniref:hypothetical protein n=1 Tax=Polaribacter uvawellassae TaxID=3133495 RepID=UPI003218FAAC
MKTIFQSIALLLFLTLSFSCSNNIEEDCNGCQTDTIGLSKENVQFSAESNSITLTTQGSGWWLSEIEFNGNTIDISGLHRIAYQLKIEEPEFTFERKNANEIFIQMTKNITGKERKLHVLLTHMNRGAHIGVFQAAN